MSEVILGAGPLGVAIARRLKAAGRDVTVHGIMGNPAYDMPGTHPDQVDGDDAGAVRNACEGAEVIYLCLNAHYVDWYDLFRPRVEHAIEAAASTGAILVYHDTMHMYRPGPTPLTESSPASAQSRKGKLRAELAVAVMDAVRSGRIRATIGRSADMYGPGALNSSFNSTLGERHFPPLLAGKTVSIIGDIDAPHTYAFVDDVAAGLVTLASDEGALGRVWHLPSAPTLSHRALLTLAFEVADQRPKIRGSKISGFFVRMIGRFQPDVAEVAEILDQFEQPLIVSHDAFSNAFGVDITPHRTALERTLAWYRANPFGANRASEKTRPDEIAR